MVDEDKVRIMTEIARDEQELGTQMINEGGYYKSDYISAHAMSVLWSFSFAYILILFLVFLYNIEYILIDFVAINYAALGLVLLLTYLIMAMLCIVIARIHYTDKYRYEQHKRRKYYADLKRLKYYYAESGKESSDAKIIGD